MIDPDSVLRGSFLWGWGDTLVCVEEFQIRVSCKQGKGPPRYPIPLEIRFHFVCLAVSITALSNSWLCAWASLIASLGDPFVVPGPAPSLLHVCKTSASPAVLSHWCQRV